MSRKEYKKIYHGVSKSITDEHTIFYASLDGTQYSSDGSYLELGTGYFNNMPTGYGYKFNGDSSARINNSYIDATQGTIDLFVNFDDYIKNTAGNAFVSLEDVSGYRVLEVRISDSGKDMMFRMFKDDLDIPIGEVLFRPNEWSGIHHVRVTWSINNYMRLYIDGILVGTSPNVYTRDICINNPKTIVIGNGRYTGQSGSGVYAHKGTLADIHISNIDRGDYFPNLPQDFIEGNAVIKPRFGQQQIKGDPMYSQVTELKVDTDHNDNMYKGGVDLSGFQRHTYKPELWLTSSNFENATMIKIKALNGEVISGVIDTDTALARIIKYVSGGKANTNIVTIEVDDNSKLVLQDTVRMYYNTTTNMLSTLIYTITSIDNNNITLTGDGNYSYDLDESIFQNGFIIETTTSSSSPVVKTQDGITVVGTWSGLGTNEATFTLGENSNISGKDLYVTYALTIPSGNSHFPELPQDIDYINNENFIKLKETNKLTIEDDFMGKTKQYGDTCSSTAHYIVNNNSLVNPTTTLNTSNEISIGDYYNISLLNMNNSINLKSSKENDVLQLICKFNLIDMVENKFSTEIPGNKLQWVKSHITKFSFYAVGRGNTTLYLSPYNVEQSDWFSLYGQVSKYNGNNFSSILYEHSGNVYPNDWINKTIDSNGNVYFCVYTDKVKPSTEFSIEISYVKLGIELNYDSKFKLYFSENRRAREDKCVPMLVQNETKTIKSYLVIKEPIVTEYKYNEFKGITGAIPDFKDYVYSNLLQLNSLGTGSYLGAASMKYKASLANITQKPTHYYTNEPIVKDVYKLYTAEDLINYRSGIKYLSRGATYNNDGYARLIVDSDSDANNFVNILPSIINIDGELRLLLLSAHFINKMHSTNEAIHFPIPNTPLLK